MIKEEILLKDGSVLIGYVIEESRQDNSLVFQIFNGPTITIEQSEIEEREQNPSDKFLYYDRAQRIRLQGYFGQLRIGENWPGIGMDNHPNVYISTFHGWFFKPWLQLGVSTGLEWLHDEDNQLYNFVPVLAEAQARLNQNKIHPFASLAVGYGISVDPFNEYSFEEFFDSGVHLRAGLGVGAGLPKGRALFSLGYLMQDSFAQYRFTNPQDVIITTVKDITFHRVELTIGWEF